MRFEPLIICRGQSVYLYVDVGKFLLMRFPVRINYGELFLYTIHAKGNYNKNLILTKHSLKD